MRTLFRLMIVLLALVGAAALLNPSAERHRDRIKQEVAARSQLAALLRLGDLSAFMADYHSLVVASYTTTRGRVLSVGAFGVVLVLEPAKE